MKIKNFSFIVMALSTIGVLQAQDNKEKKEYLPKEGSIAIGFNAVPILEYVGNLFSGSTTRNTIDPIVGERAFSLGSSTPSIFIKYFISDEIALRANIGLLNESDNSNSYVVDDENPMSEKKLTDATKTKRQSNSFSLGAEYRIGKRRIQGVFGANLLGGWSTENLTYSYGNAMTAVNQSPTTAKGNQPIRPLKEWREKEYLIGISGNVGVEYFFAPYISLGAEVSLAFLYNWGGQTWNKTETFNKATNAVVETTNILSPGDSYISFQTINLGGSLNLSFYF